MPKAFFDPVHTFKPGRASFRFRSWRKGNKGGGGALYDRILKMPTYFNKCLTVLYLHYNEAMQLLFLFFLLCKNFS